MINEKHPFFEFSNDMLILASPLKHLHINYFSFKRTYMSGEKIYLFNNTTFYKHYFEKQYYLIGNREASPASYQNGYDLWEHLPDPYNLYEIGATEFDIANGLTITKKSQNHCDFFFFATSRKNDWIKRIYVQKREIFESYCSYFLQEAAPLIAKAEKSKIILPFSTTPVYTDINISFESFMKEIQASHVFDLDNLTQREFECAHYLASGKSYKEIAIKMDLSHRTVEEHVYNIRQKFGCKNKSELISALSKYMTFKSII